MGGRVVGGRVLGGEVVEDAGCDAVVGAGVVGVVIEGETWVVLVDCTGVDCTMEGPDDEGPPDVGAETEGAEVALRVEVGVTDPPVQPAARMPTEHRASHVRVAAFRCERRDVLGPLMTDSSARGSRSTHSQFTPVQWGSRDQCGVGR